MDINNFENELNNLNKLETESFNLKAKIKYEVKKIHDECISLMQKIGIDYYSYANFWINLHTVKCSNSNGENHAVYSLSYTKANSPCITIIINPKETTSHSIRFLITLRDLLKERC